MKCLGSEEGGGEKIHIRGERENAGEERENGKGTMKTEGNSRVGI